MSKHVTSAEIRRQNDQIWKIVDLGLRHECPLQVQQEPDGPKLLIGGPEMDGVSKLFGRFCVFRNLEIFLQFSLPAVPGSGRWIIYNTTIS